MYYQNIFHRKINETNLIVDIGALFYKLGKKIKKQDLEKPKLTLKPKE